jgi:predicted Zn-dependent protease
MDPDHVLGLNNLAWLLRDKEPDQAMKYAEHAYDLAPGSVPVVHTLAVLILKAGNPSRSVELLRKAATAAPQNLQVRYSLGEALIADGQTEEGRSILEGLLAYEDLPQPIRERATSTLEATDS